MSEEKAPQLGLNNKPGVNILLCFFLGIVSVLSACYAVFALMLAMMGTPTNVLKGIVFWDGGFALIMPSLLLIANGFMWFWLGRGKRAPAIILAFGVVGLIFLVSQFLNIFVA